MNRSVKEALVVALTSIAIFATPLTAFAASPSSSAASSMRTAQAVRSSSSSVTPAMGKAADKSQPLRLVSRATPSALRPARGAVRPRLLADTKGALAREAQADAREEFNYRLGYLATVTAMKSEDYGAIDTVKQFASQRAQHTFAIEPHKGSVSSALNTQAALSAKALVEGVGPERARAFAATLAKYTKEQAGKSLNFSATDVQHANRFQRAVESVIKLGVR